MLSAQQIQQARQTLGITPISSPSTNRLQDFQSAIGSTNNAGGKPDPFAKNGQVDRAQNPLESIKEQFKSGVEDMKSFGTGNTPIQAAESGLKAESGLASAISAPLAPIFRPLSLIIGDIGNKIGDIPAVQKFAQSSAGEATSRVASDVANAGNVAGTIVGVDQAAKTAPGIVKNASDAFSKSPDAKPNIPSPAPQNPQATSDVVYYYTKAIKPTVAGKKTTGALDTYNKNVVSGISSIVKNKENLSFTTPDGEVQTGRTPQTVGELTQAIDQTQAKIFERYDALAKQTGDAGIKISTEPVVSQLDKVIANEAIQVSHPEAIKEAEAIKSRIMDMNEDKSYGEPKQFDPNVIQEIIKGYNSSLEAFYRNPTYNDASRAAVAAGTVRAFREALAKAIQGATGENYAALKEEYGALSAIEADVAKRAVVLSRQASATGGGGIADYAQVFSGGDMVHGLLSLNPALFAKGAAQSMLTKLFTHLKSPDRAITKMFSSAESLDTPTPATPKIGVITPKP